jgi:hypothetical protein
MAALLASRSLTTVANMCSSPAASERGAGSALHGTSRLRKGDGGPAGACFWGWDEPSWSLRLAQTDDREFLLRLNEATMREYVEHVWGWDEAEQTTLFENRFQPERWQIIQSGAQDIGVLGRGQSSMLPTCALFWGLQDRA